MDDFEYLFSMTVPNYLMQAVIIEWLAYYDSLSEKEILSKGRSIAWFLIVLILGDLL
jgi:hypothetical protein